MALVEFLPLAVVAALAGALAASPYVPSLDRPVTRAALWLFGPHVAASGPRRDRRQAALRASHTGETYRTYATKTVLYAAVAAVLGSVVGVYLIAAALAALAIPEAVVRSALPAQLGFLAGFFVEPELTVPQLFGLLLVSSATAGTLAGVGTSALRWYLPKYRAEERARRIDRSLARTIAFTYALSRSGMPFPDVMRALARNREAYGAAADELAVAVKQMDRGGLDVLSALRETARRTPSDRLAEFAENLASVLESGRSVSTFLYDRYEHHQEEAEAEQEQFLQLLATLAEGYVTVLVVGPLLLITILVVVGLMGIGDTEGVLRLMTYLVLPLGTVAFLVYLDGLTESVRSPRRTGGAAGGDTGDGAPAPAGPRPLARSDGGATGAANAANWERFRAYQRIRGLRRRFANPLRTVRERPTALFYLTVPLALAALAVRVALVYPETGGIPPATVDEYVVHSALFVLGTFALAQEHHRRRLNRLEAAVPDLLDRLANVNDAGMTIAASIERVSTGDLGALTEEVRRTWVDMHLGANAAHALARLEARMRTPTVTRIVTLLTNAMRASGNLAPVLRIAADDAQASRRLKRARRQEMFTYLVVIYLSFLVFLVIVVSLNAVLIPSLPTGDVGATDGAVPGSGFAGGILSGVDIEGYTLLLYHTALVQAVCSGLVAGQMGEESLLNGAKHATAMLAIAYATFTFL